MARKKKEEKVFIPSKYQQDIFDFIVPSYPDDILFQGYGQL